MFYQGVLTRQNSTRVIELPASNRRFSSSDTLRKLIPPQGKINLTTTFSFEINSAMPVSKRTRVLFTNVEIQLNVFLCKSPTQDLSYLTLSQPSKFLKYARNFLVSWWALTFQTLPSRPKTCPSILFLLFFFLNSVIGNIIIK